MRAGAIVASGLGLTLAAACSAVPDLRFGGLDDGGAVSVIDSSLPITTGGSSSGTSPSRDAQPGNELDASLPQTDDAAVPPVVDAADASSPAAAPDASSASLCPGSPPKGAQCCGTVVCRPGGIDFCDCTKCEQSCASQGACCMNRAGAFESCATSIGTCPAP
jgi:hypothetical protein